jgi:hypothetical protein
MRRAPQSSPAAKPAHAPTPQRNQEDDETSQDLEFMDELPDII